MPDAINHREAARFGVGSVLLLLAWPLLLSIVHPVDQSMPPTTVNPGYAITAVVAGIMMLGFAVRGRPKIKTVAIVACWMLGTTIAWSPMRIELTVREVEDRARHAAPLIALGTDAYYARQQWNVICDGPSFDDAKLGQMLPQLTSLKVRTLHLDRTQISDQGFTQLAGVPSLRLLYVYDTPITDEAIRQLNEKLPDVAITRTSKPARQ